MEGNKVRYSDPELDDFKKIILEKVDKAERDLELLKEQVKNFCFEPSLHFFYKTKLINF